MWFGRGHRERPGYQESITQNIEAYDTLKPQEMLKDRVLFSSPVDPKSVGVAAGAWVAFVGCLGGLAWGGSAVGPLGVGAAAAALALKRARRLLRAQVTRLTLCAGGTEVEIESPVQRLWNPGWSIDSRRVPLRRLKMSSRQWLFGGGQRWYWFTEGGSHEYIGWQGDATALYLEENDDLWLDRDLGCFHDQKAILHVFGKTLEPLARVEACEGDV